MKLRTVGVSESRKVAELHLAAFPAFFLTSLGKKFLSVFYKSIIRHPTGIAVGLYEGGVLRAFAVGASDSNAFYKGILVRNGFSLAFRAMPAIMLNPAIPFRIFRSLFTIPATCDDTDSATLLSICVSPECRVKGYGRLILETFEKEVSKVSKKITLTTDAEDNENVNQFYLRNEYQLERSFYQGKRKMNLYKKQL